MVPHRRMITALCWLVVLASWANLEANGHCFPKRFPHAVGVYGGGFILTRGAHGQIQLVRKCARAASVELSAGSHGAPSSTNESSGGRPSALERGDLGAIGVSEAGDDLGVSPARGYAAHVRESQGDSRDSTSSEFRPRPQLRLLRDALLRPW